MHFSVVIPAKNEEPVIGRCLDSLMRCRHEADDLEVIVVDNGSTDLTSSIAAARGARVLSAPGVTIAALRNLGAAEAAGEVLVFMDADCTVESEWLMEAKRYLFRDEVVCFGSPPGVPPKATWVQRAWFLVRGKGAGERDVRWLESMNMFVKRSAFFAVGGFDAKLVTCEDYDLSLRLQNLGRIVSDGRIAAVHHGEAASLCHFFKKEYWRGTSNLAGVFSHRVRLRELPSVVLPAGHTLVALVIPLLLVAGVAGADLFLLRAAATLMLAWQTPLLLMAAWKSSLMRPLITFQLYLLLNVYFLARGASLLRAR